MATLHPGGGSGWPELKTPAFQFIFLQGGDLMHLILKVVSFVVTIVLEVRWYKTRR